MSTTVDAGGFDLYVEDHGPAAEGGRTVVLVHGWPLSADSWAHQVPALVQAGHRVVAYDRRGFGRSGHPADNRYDYDALTADLGKVLDALDVTDAVVVGFSMGGGEAIRYPAQNPQGRVSAVVLAAAVPPYLLKTDDNPDGPLPSEGAEEMKAGLDSGRDTFFEGFVKDFFSANGELAVGEQETAAALGLAKQSHHPAALACIDSFARTDFRQDLAVVAGLPIPVLVIHGDADGIVPLEGSGARSHASLLNSQLHVIAGGPHGINASHAEEFNRTLLGFLADYPGTAS
ncbi:alpha/beta fold hydrolase [Nocardioides yefusunii]|uniref:Alpha/beta fold hydrolase n=1 Tax=Nocardioides yefusunii TaxID=2500546 RepID=A0ABW1QVU3_9ACTN|nr:alpha/beta hydrolase [Nocardioides yefusunii]